MLDTMPYADLLAIYNAIAEKPVARSDTRLNGVRRTEALLETHGLTLAEAARLADVVLPDQNVGQGTAPSDGAVQQAADDADPGASPAYDAAPNQNAAETGRDGEPNEADRAATILVDPGIAT